MGQKKSDKKIVPKKKKNWAREKKEQKKKNLIYWPSKLTPGGQFHLIYEIPELDFLDGTLVGAGSVKPQNLVQWFSTTTNFRGVGFVVFRCSHGVPKMFPKMFPIAPQFYYPIWFAQSSTLMYINWKRFAARGAILFDLIGLVPNMFPSSYWWVPIRLPNMFSNMFSIAPHGYIPHAQSSSNLNPNSWNSNPNHLLIFTLGLALLLQTLTLIPGTRTLIDSS